MKTFIYSMLIVLGFLIAGCRSTKQVDEGIARSIPSSYTGQKDSASSALLNRREFFSDQTLLALIDTAVKNNFDVLSAFQKIEASKAGIRFAKGAMLPTLNAYTGFNQRKFGLYTMDGAGNITTPIEGQKIVPIHLPDYYVGLQTAWEVDIWGKLKSRKVAALSRYLASQEGRNFVVTNVVSEVANTYYELLALDNQLEIIRETIRLQEDGFETIQVQQEAGYANRLGVEQFEAQLLNSRALEKKIEQQILETESYLNFLLGRYPQTIAREKSVLFSATPPDVRSGIPSDLLRFRPDIRQAEFDLLAAKADLKSARAAFLPSFNITGAYGFQAYKTSYLFLTPESIAYSILGGLTAPLINRSAIKAHFNYAKASQFESYYNYQRSILNGYVEVYNQVANIKNLAEILDLKTREAALFNQSIETSTELFSARRATYLEVIVAQRNALEAKLELVEMKKQQFNATVDLYKALGGGWQ